MIPFWYDKAIKRELFPENSTSVLDGSKVTLIVHTMVGYLDGTESYFRKNGPTGVRSHFGLGGDKDKPGQDGQLVQWNNMHYKAYAQWDGNTYGVSVECSDGAVANKPFSAKQRETLITLFVNWARWNGRKDVKLSSFPGEHGTIGYHALFPSWNKSGHACPGDTRIKEIKTILIPEANKRLASLLKEANPVITPASSPDLAKMIAASGNQRFIISDVSKSAQWITIGGYRFWIKNQTELKKFGWDALPLNYIDSKHPLALLPIVGDTPVA